MPYGNYVKTLYHLQNRKYITYRNAARGGQKNGHWQHAQGFGEVQPCSFRVMRVEQGLTSHQTHYRSYRGRVLWVKRPTQQCQSTEG